MLEGEPDAASMRESAAAFGLLLPEPEAEVCEVWAEHWPAVRVFAAMLTQWHWNWQRRTGLQYAALPVVMQQLGLRRRQRRELLPLLQVLEDEALAWWREKEK